MRRIARVFIIVAVVFGAAQAAAVEEENSGTSADLLSFERADMAVFREKLLNVDRSFTKRTGVQAERRLRRLEQSDQAIDPIDFAVELCRVAALADNAHTGCLSAPLAREICREFANLDSGTSSGCVLNTPDFNSVPLRFFPFGSAFHVVATKAADTDFLGACLVAIDGRSVNGVLAILPTFSGGTVPHRDLYASGVLSSPDQLHAVGVSRPSAAVSYRGVTPGGQTIERTFKPEQADGASRRGKVSLYRIVRRGHSSTRNSQFAGATHRNLMLSLYGFGRTWTVPTKGLPISWRKWNRVENGSAGTISCSTCASTAVAISC